MLKAFALITLIQVPAPTQDLAPGTRYDARVPTLEQVAGHARRLTVGRLASHRKGPQRGEEPGQGTHVEEADLRQCPEAATGQR